MTMNSRTGPASPCPGCPEPYLHPFQKREPLPFQFPLTPLLHFPPLPLPDNGACIPPIWGPRNPIGYANLMKYFSLLNTGSPKPRVPVSI